MRLLLILSLLAFAACGDGNGGSAATPPPDTTPPVLTLVGDDPQLIEAGTDYTELGATASDNVDGDLTNSIVVDASAVDTSMLGDYTVAYEVRDAAGNIGIVTRTVTVQDTTPPVITLIGDNPQIIEAGDPYDELGATASDYLDGDLSTSIIIDASTVDTMALGDHAVSYDVTDAAGNTATTVTRSVRVQDTIAPVITLLGDDPQAIVVGTPYDELGATAADNFDGDISDAIEVDTSRIDMSVSGDYQVLYKVSDTAGNVATRMRAVRLVVGGKWITAGSTSNSRWLHDAALLQDGRVLLVGGIFPSGPAELFDPAAETFTEVEAPEGVSFAPTAVVTALPDGRALIVGDSISDGAALVFDPKTDTIASIGALNVAREVGTDTLLADGRVLLAAGRQERGPEPDISIGNSEVFDPVSGVFTSTGSMVEPRDQHTATLLPDGTVLIAAGVQFIGGYGSLTELTSAEIFDPAVGEFRTTGAIVGTGRVSHTATLLPNGSVLIIGGEFNFSEPGVIYDISTGTSQFASPLNISRGGHAAVALRSGPGCPAPVLVAGGFVPGGERGFDATDSVEMYDTVLEIFYEVENLPGAFEYPVGTLLQDGRVLVTGAEEAWLFEPKGECL
jgi:hypothetical protein